MREPTKKPYIKPEVILELELETRAGSTIEPGIADPFEDLSLDIDINP